jgi:outer membrane receptor for ferrienterochelin and colicins
MFQKLAQKNRVLFFILAVFISFDAFADTKKSIDDYYNLTLEELGKIEISIATGNSTTLDRAPATATLISSAEIKAMGARNLDEVLETVPGLHVALSSLSRLDSIYSIRGIHTGFNAQVLLLLNGVPVQYSMQGGRPTLFRLPAASIERVEVIRGPGSAVYGADAFSGVVNVITKDAGNINGTTVTLGGGSFEGRSVSLETANYLGDVGISFNFAYQESRGDKDRVVDSDLQSTLDAIFMTQASEAPTSLSTRYQILDSHLALTSSKVLFNLWNWHSRDAGEGAGAAQALDSMGRDDSNLWMTDLTYHFTDDDTWSNSLRLSYVNYDQESEFVIFPAGVVAPINSTGNIDFASNSFVQFPEGIIGAPGAKMEDIQLDYVSVLGMFSGHRLRLAAGLRYQSVDPREKKNFGPGVIDGTNSTVDGTLKDVTDTEFVYLPDTNRNLKYLSVQDEWQLLTELTLTAGLRYDDYSDFGNTTNPRLALVWGVSENITAKLLYGRAFRAPSFTELGFKNNPVSLGNSELKPEKIDTYELAFNYRITGNLQTTLAVFNYAARDMIEFKLDLDGTGTKTAQNARDQDGEGFEFEVNWRPSEAWLFAGSYSLQNAEDAKTGNDIADAPGQQLKFISNWEFSENWFLNGQVNWVAGRERNSVDTRKNIDDYLLTNIAIKRQFVFDRMDLSLAIRNLFDEDAREPSSGEIPNDYPLESRSFWLDISYRFQ